MPSITLRCSPVGPLISVYVGVSRPRLEALRIAGIKAPPPILCTLLVDTGASGVVLDPEVIAPLGLVQTGVVHAQTPSTGSGVVQCAQYDAWLAIIGGNSDAQNAYVLDTHPVMTAIMKPQGIDGLLGRDALDNCLLFYNGPMRDYVFSW